ncbi:NAD(P)H-hydrate dehydratase [Stieleria sp. JC731]|uniref:NAD(P)H-hydrate dehydratase n=1 Tax=Pirellulaceae TaxID=2691357 RepID=UPI001E625AF7|nr:NAD(P)H-hydrate dehydratase [Stieleria sp. JC731]MCC9599741.1 NAD(P)H-hydrate dehydratase [Stieleria sp. JC731]
MEVPCPPPLDQHQAWPTRSSDAHKGNFGRVLFVGGSRGMAGSIALSSIAALTTGSGLVTTAIPDRCLETVAGYHPGIMTVPLADDPHGCFADDAVVDFEPFDAIGCGPGMRTGNGATKLVERLWHHNQTPRVFDADAINIIAQQKWLRSPSLLHDQSSLVLTPHPGELQRLTGVSAKDRPGQIEAAKKLCEDFGITIVVKGGPTCVVSACGTSGNSASARSYLNNTGNPAMATAGSGDVLTGIITSLLGQGLQPFDAAKLGVYLHGLAGDCAAKKLGQPSVTCREIIGHLPEAILAIQ